MPENAGPTWSIRPAATHDSDSLLSWRNDPTDFQWYLESSSVRVEEHRAWLAERLSRDQPSLWILDVDGRAAGTVRMDVDSPTSALASIVVDPELRGRGYGRRLLAFLDAQARNRGIRELRAVIHPENAASHALFAAAGYVRSDHDVEGFDFYALSLNPD